MRKIILLLFCCASICTTAYSQNKGNEVKNKKNRIEFSVNTIGLQDFTTPGVFIPEFGYSRYFGKYAKAGAYYRRTNYKTGITWNGCGLKAGFLPLPLLVKNEDFINNWELELSLGYNYAHEVTDYKSHTSTIKEFYLFSRMGVSRRIYRNLYGICNIEIWNQKGTVPVFIGLSYGF